MLSKSHILAHRQCPKRLWLSIHRSDLLETTGPTISMQAGSKVGEIARTLYPDGQLIATDQMQDALAETQEALGAKRPLFEATFVAADLLVRADLLIPAGTAYRLVEIKSSASVKDYHYEDIAIQAWAVKTAGLPLADVAIAHINNQFLYAGNGDYRGLFTEVSVQNSITEIEAQVPAFIHAASQTIKGSEPDIGVGDHCSKPFDCPFTEYCSPPSDSTAYPPEILPNGSALAKKLRAAGYTDLRDVPEHLLDKPKHLRVWRASKTGRAELDPEAGNQLLKLPYPRYYLDFETLAPAIPLWANTRPFQQITFQWSCHIKQGSGALDHREFLAMTRDDPRREFAESLIKVIGTTGPIFVYNAAFERSRMKELAELHPDLAPPLKAAIDRIVDLLPLAREHYYHPDMIGSWSIKAVLPAIAPELSYSDLEVADGVMAQEAFSEMIDLHTPELRKGALRNHLLMYCQRDTYGMVILAKRLSES